MRRLSLLLLSVLPVFTAASVFPVAPAAAQGKSVAMPVTIDVDFSGSLPKFLSIRGNVPETQIDDQAEMKGTHTIDASFDRDKPSEIILSVTAMWSDDNYDTRRLNLLPSNTTSSVPIRFLTEGPNTILFKTFNLSDAKRQIQQRCVTPDSDFDVRYFNYRRCFFIFSLMKNSDMRHFGPAFDALKGSFDKYYSLFKEKSIPLARDTEIEREALEYESAAATDPAVQRAFEKKGVPVGYFKGMINQLSNLEVAPYRGVQLEATSRQIAPESVPALQIETQLIKGRFVQEQARLEELKGQAPKTINGITLDHIDGLIRTLDTLSPTATVK